MSLRLVQIRRELNWNYQPNHLNFRNFYDIVVKFNFCLDALKAKVNYVLR